jgi:hypothetical protein
MVQFSALVYFSLICTEEEAKQLSKQDKPEERK